MATDIPHHELAFSEDEARRVIAPHVDKRGPLLVVLQAIQEAFGYVDDAAIGLVAEALNVSRAEVFGVVTFYRDFRREPPARSVVRVCRAEACQSLGADALVAHAEATLHTKVGGRTPDGAIALEQVFCLGNCALSPAVMVNGRLIGRVDAGRLEEIVESLR